MHPYKLAYTQPPSWSEQYFSINTHYLLFIYQDDEMSEEIHPYESSIQAYICKFLPRVGKLNAELCVDFGVPPGPLFGQLKAGKSFKELILLSVALYGEDIQPLDRQGVLLFRFKWNNSSSETADSHFNTYFLPRRTQYGWYGYFNLLDKRNLLVRCKEKH